VVPTVRHLCSQSWPPTRDRGQMHQYIDVEGSFPPRKPIPPDRYELFYQMAGNLRHSQLKGLDSGGSASYQFLRSTAGATEWRGSNFESRLIQILQRLGVKKTRTTRLHPQSDGTVELYIKTVEEHLWKVVTSHQRDWDARLPIFLLAYRASTQDTTGLTPASLVFGREFRLPCDLLFGIPTDKERPSIDQAANLMDHLHDIHNYARQHLWLASCAGDKVWLYRPSSNPHGRAHIR
jgi:hypothetical protein